MACDLDRGAGRESNQEQSTKEGNFAEEKKVRPGKLARGLDDKLSATGEIIRETARN